MKRFSLKFFLMLLVCLGYNDICSAQGQWQQIGEDGLVASNALEQSLAFDSEGTPYVAYQDKAKNYRVTVKKFDGSNWVTVGESAFSEGYAKSISLVISGNDNPFVAYLDNGIDAEGIIKRFNGKNWVNAGPTNFSVDYAAGISLAVNNKGNIYTVFQEKDNEGRATVKRFNGANWINVGGNGLSKSYANNISLAFDSNDVPYISFVDEETGGKALVKRFDGKSWDNLNSTGLDDKYVTGLSIAIDGKNNPYIIYRDETADYKATVKKYNGESWEVVGTAGFSDGKVQHTKLVATNKGTLYAAYVDFGNGAIGKVGTTNVRKFNGESWEDISYPNVRTVNNLDNKFSLSLLLNKNDIPHLAFSNKASGGKATVLKLSTTEEPNKRPVANAGDDINITLPTKKIQLKGSGSDEDGTISSYLWRQVSGPNKAKFDNTQIESPTVTNLVVGVYVFSLTTKDNKNTSSSADKITLTVLESEVPLQKVESFTLIDADTKKGLQKLTDGATINLANYKGKKLTIRANTNAEVGSVVFELTGEQNKKDIENIAPYDMIGDDNHWSPVVGDYNIKATPFINAGGNGDEGSGLEVNFSVINEDAKKDGNNDPGELTFILIDADKNKEIHTLKDGATINLAELPTRNISIRVDTKAKVGSVKMDLSGKLNRLQVESIAPYSLFGGNNGNYNPWAPLAGNYTLEITPYSGRAGKGEAGSSTSINFKIINSTSASAARKAQEIKESVSDNSIMVYPNPTADDLHIEVGDAGEGEATINLLDTSGRKVLTKKLNTTSNLNTVLNVNHLHPGVYILVINTAKGQISKRVVIQ